MKRGCQKERRGIRTEPYFGDKVRMMKPEKVWRAKPVCREGKAGRGAGVHSRHTAVGWTQSKQT